MIKAYSAYTYEIDDVDLAVNEIIEQLNLNGKLLKNTIGIISCFAEYIDSGVIEELCKNLPFKVAGITTIANASKDVLGEMMLNLLVLTSDAIEFAVSLSDPISSSEEEPIRKGYERALSKLPGKPSLMLSFAPLLLNVSGDFYVDALSRISGNVPNFGTLTVDHTEDYRYAKVILDGEAYKDRCAFVLMYGDVKAKFYISHISKERVFEEQGVVTKSRENQLQMVNGAPVVEYLYSLGLKADENGNIAGLNSFPVIVDHNDGTAPIARAIFALTSEGYAVCGGHVPDGSTLSIGEFNAEEIKNTTSDIIKTALEENPNGAFLIYSCVGRYFAQDGNLLDEAECIRRQMGQKGAEYLFAYSGCEICPVYTKEGLASNRSHNISIIICALQTGD